MKLTLLLSGLIASCSFASEQKAPVEAVSSSSEQAVVTDFDKAMRTCDGKLFLSVLRSSERRGLTADICTRFLKQYVKPWYEAPSVERLPDGSKPRLNAANCHIVIAFAPTGGKRWEVVNLPRKVVFKTPVIKEGNTYKASVGFAQILFSLADDRANGPGRGKIAEMQLSQTLVESWIPSVKKLGINGSVDPETGKFHTWDEIIALSRAELKKYEALLNAKGKG